jgi:hypothetical protein
MLKAVKFTRKQNGAVLTFCTSSRVIRYVVIGYFVERTDNYNCGTDARAFWSSLTFRPLPPNQSVSVSVALLLAGVGSVTPLGTVTVAVLEMEPVADALTVPVAL